MSESRLRVLCIGETWLGSDARAAFMALRRLGHSIHILDEAHYFPSHWRLTPNRIARRVLKGMFVQELVHDAARLVNRFKPHCLFVFKGSTVHPRIVEHARNRGAAAVNYYPDVSFMVHGPFIPKALPLYDRVFTTKSYGLKDMRMLLGVDRATFLEPGYDPELHRPVDLTQEEKHLYDCDAVFIGTWSPKKEALLTSLQAALPDIRLKVWGCQWDKSRSRELMRCVVGDEVTGDEYTKAMCGAKICLGLLSEQRPGASSGDLITARTFQIPACGAFMLHERNLEVLRYFNEDSEAAFFEGSEELAQKVRFYLTHDGTRNEIASNGLRRSVRDEYSIDGRMKTILSWLEQRIGAV